MNIGIDIRPLMSSLRTGVGEYTYELLNAIFRIDQTNQYYLFYNSQKDVSGYLPQWNLKNVHGIRTTWPNKVFNATATLINKPRLDKLIKIPLDFFFSPNLNFTPLTHTVRHLLTIHDLSFEFFPEFFTLKQRLWHKITRPKKQCEEAYKIIVPSLNSKEDLINIYQIPEKKIQIIPHGLSSVFNNFTSKQLTNKKEEIKKKYFLTDNFILFLGTIEPRKNITGLVRAYEQISAQLPDHHSLIIAGAPGWKNKKIYEIAEKSKIKNNIKFIGYIPLEDKPAIYAAASLFVYPSFYEGFGFPVLEAMSAGTPVVTAQRSALPEISAKAAYLINPNKTNEIAQAIKNILSDPNLRARQIKNGQELAAKFSWDQAAHQWLDLLC